MKNNFTGGVMKNAQKANLISRWKKVYAAEQSETGTAVPQKEACTQPEASSKIPVIFRLSRFEHPEDFERMQFVIKACVKYAVCPYKTVLHVEQTRTGSRLVACDGVRLHFAEIAVKIKSGDYKPTVTKDAIILGQPLPDIRFPDWTKVIPVKTRKRGVINLKDAGFGRDRDKTEKLSLAFASLAKQIGEPVNLRFLEDLPKREWAVYSQGEKQKAILLKEKAAEDKLFAVIMPIPQAA